MQNKDGYNVLYINNTDIHTGIIVYTDDNKCNAGDIVRVTGDVKETDYIFDKTIKCDVCGKEFKTKQVRTGKARFIGTDDY